jgi:ADP-ribose pyrophosphatase YjhB (NUDIX family)
MADPNDRFVRAIPDGDNRERLVCRDCGFVHYDNPKIVVGSVCTWENRILLCRRAIPPSIGLWTLPAGYLEVHETPVRGAQREAMEEACADIEIDQLLAVYSIPRISQVQLIYRARLRSPSIAAGPESQAVGLYAWEEIPWAELAFPSVRWGLQHFREVCDLPQFTVRSNPVGESGDH